VTLGKRLEKLERRSETTGHTRIEIWEEDLNAREMVRDDGWRLSVAAYEERQKTRTPGPGQTVTSIVIKRARGGEDRES
jgi:hypothetical protein